MSQLQFLEHFPYCRHPELSTVQELRGFGTRGETVAISCSVICSEDIAEMTLSAPTMVSETGIIDSSYINVYLVKSRELSGVGIYQSSRMTVPEFLLKDDRTPLEDGYIEHRGQGIGSESPLWLYCPPRVRLCGDACTSLVAGEYKQIWLSVRIPNDAVAANYRGCLQVKTLSVSYELPLELEVLPFNLLEPVQDLMLWYRGTMDPAQAQFYVSPDQFRLQLQDIHDHGFRSISICERDRTTAQLAIEIAEQVGFDRHIVFRSIPFNAEALRFKKLTPIYYLSEEIDAITHKSDGEQSAAIAEHQGHNAYCKILQWQSMASLKDHQFIKRMEDDADVGCKPTMVSLYLPNNVSVFAGNEPWSNRRQYRTYYHWPSHMEKPNLHRVLSGLYLWKTKADGIAPYCYQHPPVFPFSPFDDFGAWEPALGLDKFRNQMTTYPAHAGIISTLQWEGHRDGIIDLRYLTTLDCALSAVDSLPSQEARVAACQIREKLDSFLNRIGIESVEIESDFETEGYPQIAAYEYQHFRRQIASDISQLHAYLAYAEESRHTYK